MPKRKSRHEKRARDVLLVLARAALINDGMTYSATDGVDRLLAKMPDYQAAGLRKQAVEEAGRSNATDDQWQTADYATP